MHVQVKFLNDCPKHSLYTREWTYDAPDDTIVGDLVMVPTNRGSKYARVVRIAESNYPGSIRTVQCVWRQVKQMQSTVDEAILTTLRRKQTIAEAVLDS